MSTAWLCAFLAWSVFLFGSGVWVEHKVNLASQDHAETIAASALGKGGAAIIKDNQILYMSFKNNPDPCLKKDIPDGTD